MVNQSETTNVYRNTDGTYRADVFPGPVNWQDGETWRIINANLAEVSPGVFESGSTPVSAKFRTSGGELLTLAGEDWSLGMGPQGASASRSGQASGSRMEFPNLLGPGISLQYKVTATGVKEYIRLERRLPGTKPSSFRFPLHLEGLSARTDTSGTIEFVDGAGEVVLYLPRGYAFDSAAGPAQSVAPVQVRLVGSPGNQVVEVSVDWAWFDAPERVYPVYIDPTLWFGTGTNDATSHDTYISSAYPYDNYNGSRQQGCNQSGCWFRNLAGHWANNYYDEFQSLMSYDIGPAMGHYVSSAVWNGRFKGASGWSGSGHYFSLHPIGGDWTPSGVTWNNRPWAIGETATGSVPCCEGSWGTADVTSWVRNWASRTWDNDGLLMATDGRTNHFFDSYADEESDYGTYHHYLSVNFSNRTPSAPCTLSPGSVVTTTTPTFSGTFNDPDGDSGDLQFNIYDAAGNFLTYGYGNVTTSGGTSSWAVPAGTLLPGSTYRWRAYSRDIAGAGSGDCGERTLRVNRIPEPPGSLRPDVDEELLGMPTFSAQYRDPDGDSGHIVFTIFDETGELLFEGAGSQSTSGHRSFWQPSAESLPCCYRYMIEARSVDVPGGVSGRTVRTPFILNSTDGALERMPSADEVSVVIDLDELAVSAANHFGSRYGGYWLEGVGPASVVKLAATDPTLDDLSYIASVTTHPERVSIVDAVYSYSQLGQFRENASAELRPLQGDYTVGIVPSTQKVRVVVGAIPPNLLLRLQQVVPADVLQLVVNPSLDVVLASTDRTLFPPYEAGIHVDFATGRTAGACTSGFAFVSGSTYYGSTSGHCAEDPDSGQIATSASLGVRCSGSNCRRTEARISANGFTARGSDNVVDIDALRYILFPGLGDTVTDLVHTGERGPRGEHRIITSKFRRGPANAGGIGQGQRLCYQGITSKNNNCGNVNEFDHEAHDEEYDVSVRNLTCIDNAGGGGDSGGPVYEVRRDGSARAAGLFGLNVRGDLFGDGAQGCFYSIWNIESHFSAQLVER